jgi:phage-related protein
VIDSFFELLSDIIMLIIDLIQALIEGFTIGWHKALNTSSDFKHDAHL